MATKKDLIEAQGFSRRRLLSAFVGGAPGGKELEPAKPLRAVAAGIALTAMLIIGGVFYGLVRPGLPDGWDNNKLIVASDTGARYVSINGTLYPVINTASARLLIPAGEYKVITTDQGTLEGIPVGQTIGIPGAPDALPAPQLLANNGWAACAAGGESKLGISPEKLATATDKAIVASADGAEYVISGGTRWRVDQEQRDSVLRTVGLASATVVAADGAWINLFSDGGDLAPIRSVNAGYSLGNGDLIVGSVVHPTGSPADERYLVTAQGELAPMTALAFQLYLLGDGATLGPDRDVNPANLSALKTAAEPAGEAGWPTAALTPLEGSSLPCAILDNTDGTAKSVLGTAIGDTALTGTARATVHSGSGALVLVGGVGAGIVYLIDESATAYPVPGADNDVLARLGYAPTDLANVSSAWLSYFSTGSKLTESAAQQSPITSGASADALMADDCSASVQFSTDVPTAITALNTAEIWKRATGAGVTVAIVDSGIDGNNPHLTTAVRGGTNLVPDGANGSGLSDNNGHGTVIAGEIGAREVDGSGVVGVAKDATLLSVRVFRGTDEQSVKAGLGPSSSRLASGIRYATDHGAQIINVSLSDYNDSPSLESAVRYATANGSLVVASAGNRNTASGVSSDTVRFPAGYDGVLGVTATDALGTVTEDSIHGPQVAVAAPGSNVLSTATGGGDCVYAADAASSSFATAYASAAAALVAQAHPDESPAQWLYRLEATAVRSNPDERDDINGWGMINPLAAIELEPSSDTRGPESPFANNTGSAVTMPVVSITPTASDHAFELTRETMAIVLIGATAVLGSLGVVLVLRRWRLERR
jgi:type VII secretion-associated serine protease mycosin/type VII secretion protein EccB